MFKLIFIKRVKKKMSERIELSITQDLIISGVFVSALFIFLEILQNFIDNTFSQVHMWKLTVVISVISIGLIYMFLKKTFKHIFKLRIEFLLAVSIMIECVINLLIILSDFMSFAISFGIIVLMLIQTVLLSLSIAFIHSIINYDLIYIRSEGKDGIFFEIKKKS